MFCYRLTIFVNTHLDKCILQATRTSQLIRSLRDWLRDSTTLRCDVPKGFEKFFPGSKKPPPKKTAAPAGRQQTPKGSYESK